MAQNIVVENSVKHTTFKDIGEGTVFMLPNVPNRAYIKLFDGESDDYYNTQILGHSNGSMDLDDTEVVVPATEVIVKG